MNLKSFLIASLIIHVVGAVALYFYYNPITFAPKPVRVFEEEKEQLEGLEKPIQSSDTKESFVKKIRKKKAVKKSRKKALSPTFKNPDQNKSSSQESLVKSKVVKKEKPLFAKQDLTGSPQNNLIPEKDTEQTDLDFKTEEADLISTQEQALSEAKEPLPDETKEPFIDTTDSPLELNLEEIKEENKPLNQDTQIEKDFEELETSPQSVEEDSKGLEKKKPHKAEKDFEELETSPQSVEEDSKGLEKKKPHKAEKDFEELETSPQSVEEDSKGLEKKKPHKAEKDFEELKTSPQGAEEDSKGLEKNKLQQAEKDIEEQEEKLVKKTQTSPVKTIVSEQKASKADTKKESSSSTNEIKRFQSLKTKRGNPPLSYPVFARRSGMEGTVSVLFFVTNQGLVEQIQLASSSGHSELDNYVLRTLARYEFLPGQESWVRHKIPFVLDGVEEEPSRYRRKK